MPPQFSKKSASPCREDHIAKWGGPFEARDLGYHDHVMTRLSALKTSAGLALAAAAPSAPAAPTGRLKQSAARWCYNKMPLDDFCRQAAEMGLSGVDLVE